MAEGPNISSTAAQQDTPSLVYDNGQRGARMLSMIPPIVLGISLLMIFLAITWPFVSTMTSTTWLQAAFLFVVGAWMGLHGLHYRRDRQAFTTRYVLCDAGLEVTSPDSSPRLIPWSQIAAGYHIRILRYFRLVGPAGLEIVLMFGALPKAETTGQLKYKRTGRFIAQKLGDRLTTRWL